ncbi:MAG: hypothetical protein AAGL29_14820 [Bacteroidota bacterium]
MRLKKIRPVMFPNHNEHSNMAPLPFSPKKVKLGAAFKIGRPANASYLFLENSLPKVNPNRKIMIPVNRLVDQVVTIIGIVERANQKKTAILQRMDKNQFCEGQQKIYADVENAVIAQELIAL